jgi:hypothetical protein
MVYWSIAYDWRVADEFLIKRVLLALQGFLLFNLDWFCCIRKQATNFE